MTRSPTPRRSYERGIVTPDEAFLPECPVPRQLPAQCLTPALPPKEWLYVEVREGGCVEGRKEGEGR